MMSRWEPCQNILRKSLKHQQKLLPSPCAVLQFTRHCEALVHDPLSTGLVECIDTFAFSPARRGVVSHVAGTQGLSRCSPGGRISLQCPSWHAAGLIWVPAPTASPTRGLTAARSHPGKGCLPHSGGGGCQEWRCKPASAHACHRQVPCECSAACAARGDFPLQIAPVCHRSHV